MMIKRTKAKQSAEWASEETIDQVIYEDESEVKNGDEPIPLETARKELDEKRPN